MAKADGKGILAVMCVGALETLATRVSSVVNQAVDVAPMRRFIAFKATGLVQSISAPTDLVSCDEFDFGVLIANNIIALDLKAEPSRAFV